MNHRKHSHTSGTIPLIVAAYLFLWGFHLGSTPLARTLSSKLTPS